MPLINYEISVDLTWYVNCVICQANRAITFAITNTKLYVPVATLSTQDNAKQLQQLKSGFKCTINWNKYQSKVSTQAQNRDLDLDYLIDPSFQGEIDLLHYSLKTKHIEDDEQDVISQL